MTIGRDLSDIFSRAAANIKSVFKPESKLTTYRYTTPYQFNVVNEHDTSEVVFYGKVGQKLGWAEAVRIDSGKYRISVINEIRHNMFAVEGNGNRSEKSISLKGGKDIFSRDEAVKLLAQLEQDFAQQGWRVASMQPLRALHYSRFQAKEEGREPSPGPL